MNVHKLPLPPFVCIPPSECPFEGAIFDKLRQSEQLLLQRGIKVRIVIFDTEPDPILGITLFKAAQERPTEEQLRRIYISTCEFRSFADVTSQGGA